MRRRRFFVQIDDGNVVGGGRGEVLGDGRTDLPAADDEDFHDAARFVEMPVL